VLCVHVCCVCVCCVCYVCVSLSVFVLEDVLTSLKIPCLDGSMGWIPINFGPSEDTPLGGYWNDVSVQC
jgi:hypothetical protein